MFRYLFFHLFIYVCLWMLWVCVFVFTCMGVHVCVHEHTGVRMDRDVGCMCRPGLGTGHFLPWLFTLNALFLA